MAAEKNIESLRQVLEQLPDSCLALVGDGPHRQALEDHFRGTNAVFCGYLHGEELARAYGSADLFVFPSTTETLGLVILEAMSSGLPVIAANSEPTCEQIEHGLTGVIYDPSDPCELVNAIEILDHEEA